MSVNLTDLKSGCIFDILADRGQRYLLEYFNSYPLRARKAVEYVTTDMYTTYIDLVKRVFPNAKIVIDKFYIVQFLTRGLNKLRINGMKNLNINKILKRYWKILLAKNLELNSIYFYKNKHFKKVTLSVDILEWILKVYPNLGEADNFYQIFLLSIEKNDISIF